MLLSLSNCGRRHDSSWTVSNSPGFERPRTLEETCRAVGRFQSHAGSPLLPPVAMRIWSAQPPGTSALITNFKFALNKGATALELNLSVKHFTLIDFPDMLFSFSVECYHILQQLNRAPMTMNEALNTAFPTTLQSCG